MVKRKTSCSNARMCSMLLTNVTRSASYEALPNHCLFPVRSGLTSRFPLRNRWLWVDRVGDRRCYAILARNSLMENWKASLNSVSTCLKVVDTRRWVVILSFVEEWLRIAMVRTRINEHFAQPFCFFHGGKKIEAGLRGARIFAPSNHQDGTLEFLELFCIYFVEAEPVNDDARAHCFRMGQICVERFQSAHAKSDGRQLSPWSL